MGIFKSKNVEFIVSPYESDSQLAKLKFLGIVDTVITEDSDSLEHLAHLFSDNSRSRLSRD